MKKTILLATIILILIVYFTDWSSREEKIDKYLLNNQVLSLKNLLTATDVMAQAWEKNAYLKNAVLYIGQGRYGTVFLFYESPSQANIGLMIIVENGEITQERTGTKMNLSSEISKKDWIIDSQEILEIAMNQKDVYKFAKDHRWNIYGDIELERDNRLPTYPLLWQLTLIDNRDWHNQISVYLDPITGNRIEDENIK